MKPARVAALTGNRALEARLAAMLEAASARVLFAEKLSGGAIQENWAIEVEADGETHGLVLRRDAPAAIAASRSRREEFLLTRAAWVAGVRTPRPVGFCEDPEPIGAPFALMERVGGVAYGPKVVRDAGLGGDRAALGRELADATLSAVLGPPPQDAGLAEIARLRGWLDAMGAARPGLEWALRRAELRAPPPAAPVLTHQDFRTGNFLLDAGGLTAILDWEFAALSDPMADLGWFCAGCWRFSRPDLEGGGVCRREDFYAGYEAESGRAPDHDRVRWWELMAHVRWAVIALQQGRRSASGEERSLHLALTARIADPVELMALRLTAALEEGR